ncbi:MAG: endolytic transglycosylase MltG [Oligoflexia bacterium]|nr:endolytic transglycosylase MltG [Oligoflexia bacterium]
MNSKIVALRTVSLVLVPIVVALLVYRFLVGAIATPADPANTTEVSVEIQPGMTFRDVCRTLKERGIIRYSRGLEILAKIKGKPTDKISSGEYMLSAAMEPGAILEKLVSGDIVKRKVMLVEGMTIADLARVVGESGLIPAEEMTRALKDQGLLARAGISSPSFEGYLDPETYIFSRPVTAQEIIWKMLLQAESKWPQEFTDQADKLGLSRHEVLTLASVIQKESGKADEYATISSVFHNRLKAGMKLQSDPTVIYGLQNFNGNLTKEDLQNPHPYNTYVNFGLPPAPICNPNVAAIRAALFPTETQYLFFVADGSGGHTFSATLTEHNEAVQRIIGGIEKK